MIPGKVETVREFFEDVNANHESVVEAVINDIAEHFEVDDYDRSLIDSAVLHTLVHIHESLNLALYFADAG